LFPVLALNDEIYRLAEMYFEKLDIPEKARLDAFHVATACWYKIDYLVSWNLKHIVNAQMRKRIGEMNATLNIHTPVICTPEELMEI